MISEKVCRSCVHCRDPELLFDEDTFDPYSLNSWPEGAWACLEHFSGEVFFMTPESRPSQFCPMVLEHLVVTGGNDV